MKRTYLLLLLLFMYWMYVSAQQVQTAQEPADSVKNVAYIDSLYRELPEVMITGERPVVKAEQGKLVYDVPRLVGSLPVDNAYDAVKNLPGDLFDYECVMCMAILCSSVLSAIYCHKKQRNIEIGRAHV